VKIYLLCDMEGTSGIWRPDQVDRSSPHFQLGQELLVADVNAAVAGAFDGGAAELVVCDTHGGGHNFAIDKMDERPVYETPGGGSPLPALDESFAGLILTGHHAMAGTLNGFLDHTRNSAAWFRFTINGQAVGEIGIETGYAGHFGVPLIMVTGDQAACDEAEATFPGVVTVPVKWGLGRNRARCLPPARARELIRRGAAAAVAKAKQLKPWRIEPPITLELTLYRSDYADGYAGARDVERLDARTLRKTVARQSEVFGF
jgi:D-amino peptidase